MMPAVQRRSLAAALLALLALAPVLTAGAPAAATGKGKKKPAPRVETLAERIEKVLAQPDAARAHWGIQVVSLDSGKTLYANNEHKLFTPASNTKLFTTALALSTLGPGFRFKTTVETEAAPDKYGRVAGDLWLVGRGDPNLSAIRLPYKGRIEREGPPLRALDMLADQVVRYGVRFIDGDIVADDTYFVFERFGEGWAQDDLVWWYGAPVSALSVNDNVLFVEVLPGERPGDRALVKLDPFQDYYQIENHVQTLPAARNRPAPGGGGPAEAATSALRRIEINRQPGSFELDIWGRIPADDPGFREQVAIEDPALFAGKYLREALLQRGVIVYGQVRVKHAQLFEFDDLRVAPPAGPPAPSRTVVAGYDSGPLADDLKVISKVSQNLHAEMVLRTVARERRGIGSVRAGLEEMKAFLSQAGVPPEEYAFFDGSGLSRQNLVSPAAVVGLLLYMERQPSVPAWRELLPVAAVDGSIRSRFRDTPAAGRLQAKTGTLGHVSALSGYATTAAGERVAFSIFVNNHNVTSRVAESWVDRVTLAVIE